MLPLTWTIEALNDLDEITTYISGRNPVAAERLEERFTQLVELLPAHPYLFRPGRVAGTREIVAHPNYIIVYRVTTEIEIVAIVHARRNYPDS